MLIKKTKMFVFALCLPLLLMHGVGFAAERNQMGDFFQNLVPSLDLNQVNGSHVLDLGDVDPNAASTLGGFETAVSAPSGDYFPVLNVYTSISCGAGLTSKNFGGAVTFTSQQLNPVVWYLTGDGLYNYFDGTIQSITLKDGNSGATAGCIRVTYDGLHSYTRTSGGGTPGVVVLSGF